MPELALECSASKSWSCHFFKCFSFQGLGGRLRLLSTTSRSDDDEGEGRSLEARLAWEIFVIKINKFYNRSTYYKIVHQTDIIFPTKVPAQRSDLQPFLASSKKRRVAIASLLIAALVFPRLGDL